MKHAYAISSLCRQLKNVAELADSIALGIQDTEQGITDLSQIYFDVLLRELENAQNITLKMTELIVSVNGEATANVDGNAFEQDTQNAESVEEESAPEKEEGA